MHDGTPLNTFTDLSTMGLCHLKTLNCCLHLQHVQQFISDDSNLKNNPNYNPKSHVYIFAFGTVNWVSGVYQYYNLFTK